MLWASPRQYKRRLEFLTGEGREMRGDQIYDVAPRILITKTTWRVCGSWPAEGGWVQPG
jgi:hypothetical protein